MVQRLICRNTHYLGFGTSGLFVWVPSDELLEEEVAFGCQCTQNQIADVAAWSPKAQQQHLQCGKGAKTPQTYFNFHCLPSSS